MKNKIFIIRTDHSSKLEIVKALKRFYIDAEVCSIEDEQKRFLSTKEVSY